MYPLYKQIAIIVALTAIGSAFSLLTRRAPLPWVEPALEPGEIKLSEARVLDVLWIDARSLEAFETASVPGALHFDPYDGGATLADVIAAWLVAPRVIVVYCSDAGCGTSREVAESLRTVLPDAEIYSLKGGWEAFAR